MDVSSFSWVILLGPEDEELVLRIVESLFIMVFDSGTNIFDFIWVVSISCLFFILVEWIKILEFSINELLMFILRELVSIIEISDFIVEDLKSFSLKIVEFIELALDIDAIKVLLLEL